MIDFYIFNANDGFERHMSKNTGVYKLLNVNGETRWYFVKYTETFTEDEAYSKYPIIKTIARLGVKSALDLSDKLSEHNCSCFSCEFLKSDLISENV